jgi:hypothetical protein
VGAFVAEIAVCDGGVANFYRVRKNFKSEGDVVRVVSLPTFCPHSVVVSFCQSIPRDQFCSDSILSSHTSRIFRFAATSISS